MGRYCTAEKSGTSALFDEKDSTVSESSGRSVAIAGWALGTAVGYWTTTRATPFSVQILPRGLTVGYYKRF